MLKVSYGIDVADDRDPYVQIASDAMYATGNGGVPATSLVEFFPFGEKQSIRTLSKTYMLTTGVAVQPAISQTGS